MTETTSRPVFVIGPQRTGSSLVAGVCHRLGIPMGISPVTPNHRYYESDELIAFCQSIVGDWRCPQMWFIDEPHLDQWERYLARQNAEHEIWGAKAPTMCLVAHWLLPLAKGCRVIITERDFEATVDSLSLREREIPKQVCRHIQAQSFAAMLRVKRTIQHRSIPTAVVHFNAILRDPRGHVDALVDFLFGGLDASPSESAIREAVEFIDPTLNHHESEYRQTLIAETNTSKEALWPAK